MTNEEKMAEALEWLCLPVDGGYAADSREFGDLMIIADLQDGDRPAGIAIYRTADLIAWVDRTVEYAQKNDIPDEELYMARWEVEVPSDIERGDQ
jgi:hypothetical protein